MREIKFRGTTPKGEIVYGDLTHKGGNVFVGDKRVVTFDQFAGYDENGEELYDGEECDFGRFTSCSVAGYQTPFKSSAPGN